MITKNIREENNLQDLIKSKIDRKWNKVLDVCLCYPEKSKFLYEDGETLLHLVLRHYAPIEVIEAVYEAYPKAATEKDNDGWTPLHLATYCNHPFNVLYVLLSIDQSAVLKKNNLNDTPMMLFRFPKDCYDIIQRVIQYPSDKPYEKNITEYIDKMSLIIQSAYLGNLNFCFCVFDENGKYYIDHSYLLHALVAIGPVYPRGFFLLALRIYRDNTHKKCLYGNLPIHAAIGFVPSGGWKTKDINVMILNNSLYDFFDWKPQIKDHIPFRLKNKTKEELVFIYFYCCTVNELLKCYPKGATITNAEGSLPLHSCIQNCAINWISIFKKYPFAMYAKNSTNYNFYVFMIAGMYGNINCCYELLRMSPELLL